MTDLATYKIEMSLAGKMTGLPDSQKIFGALIYMYAEQFGADKTTELVSQIRDGELPFSVSNMLPLGYLPLPHTYLLDQLAQEEKEDKPTYKALKSRQFVRREQLDSLLKNAKAADDTFPYVTLKSGQQIHAAIDSVRYQLPGLDPNLYSVPETTVVEVERKSGATEQSVTVITDFMFYLTVQANGRAEELFEALKQSLTSGRRFVLGPRASQGMNTFLIKQISVDNEAARGRSPEADGRHSGAYLNLGMLLPSTEHLDWGHSAIKLFTSERRPFAPQNGWETRFAGQFISFVEMGSILQFTEGADEGEVQFGRSITSPFDDRHIVFGQSFLLPISLEEGRAV